MEINLVEMFLPEMNDEFVAAIPAQRAFIDKCLSRGVVRSYSLAADRSKVWIVFNTDTEVEMRQMLRRFPIINWVTYRVYPLMFHHTMDVSVPALSLN